MIELAGGLGKEAEKELFSNFSSRRLTSHNLCSTDTDTRIGIGRIRIRGYANFPKNLIRGYV
jgi:hypothetical protein